MRTLTTLILSFLAFANCQAQVDTLEYGKRYDLVGIPKLRIYELPSGLKLETYILILEKAITVAKNVEWDAVAKTYEVHLNIMNPEIEGYVGKKLKVSGTLFHALTIHHIREACIKVDSIEELK